MGNSCYFFCFTCACKSTLLMNKSKYGLYSNISLTQMKSGISLLDNHIKVGQNEIRSLLAHKLTTLYLTVIQLHLWGGGAYNAVLGKSSFTPTKWGGGGAETVLSHAERWGGGGGTNSFEVVLRWDTKV